ncbi:MAG TPA: DNA-binding domain-containing protein [Pyrinomonadaceae bacterium]|nr:DNA-binding domain-containing protein [Pyrinomonadaceae bacterium]
MTTEQSLGRLQLWMKTVVTERGSLADKLQTATQLHGLSIEDVVAEKCDLPAHKRLGIYTSGYVARLLECMRADFPALRRFVGEPVFDAFAKAYIVTEPSHSPSLFDLGAGFPRFLDQTKPTNKEMGALLDLPAEIARLERARTEVMRARGVEEEPAPPLFSPLEIFTSDLKVQATPCLRLLELKFSLADFFDNDTDQEQPPPPEQRRSFVAIGRFDYRIHVKEIEHWQFAFLQACENPASAHVAAGRAAEESGTEPAVLLAQLVLWLPVAMQFGLLRPV